MIPYLFALFVFAVSVLSEPLKGEVPSKFHIWRDRVTPANRLLFSGSRDRLSKAEHQEWLERINLVEVQPTDYTSDWWKWDEENQPEVENGQSLKKGELYGAYVEFLPAAAASSVPTVIAFHGRGENVKNNPVINQQLADRLGARVIAIEYPGYSVLSGSRATQRNVLVACRAVIRYLVQSGTVELNEQTFFYGFELGTGYAVDTLYGLNERQPGVPVGGLILGSPFTRFRAVARDHYPSWLVKLLLPKDTLQVREKLSVIPQPTTIIAARNDRFIAVEQSRLLALVRERKDLPIRFRILTGKTVNAKAVQEQAMTYLKEELDKAIDAAAWKDFDKHIRYKKNGNRWFHQWSLPEYVTVDDMESLLFDFTMNPRVEPPKLLRTANLPSGLGEAKLFEYPDKQNWQAVTISNEAVAMLFRKFILKDRVNVKGLVNTLNNLLPPRVEDGKRRRVGDELEEIGRETQQYQSDIMKDGLDMQVKRSMVANFFYDRLYRSRIDFESGAEVTNLVLPFMR